MNPAESIIPVKNAGSGSCVSDRRRHAVSSEPELFGDGTRNSYNSAFRNDAAALFRMRRLKNVEGILCGGAVAGERYMGL